MFFFQGLPGIRLRVGRLRRTLKHTHKDSVGRHGLKNSGAAGHEHMLGKLVLKIENAHHRAMNGYGNTERRLGLVLSDVRIMNQPAYFAPVIINILLATKHIADDSFRQQRAVA
ncbi:hypothetical protein D3C81_1407220 [compost metagenome]